MMTNLNKYFRLTEDHIKHASKVLSRAFYDSPGFVYLIPDDSERKEKLKYVFEYVTGALENTFIDESQPGILYKFGIKEHACEILEGGKEAFKEREQKYGFDVNW